MWINNLIIKSLQSSSQHYLVLILRSSLITWDRVSIASRGCSLNIGALLRTNAALGERPISYSL